jgi:hypothetical protein
MDGFSQPFFGKSSKYVWAASDICFDTCLFQDTFQMFDDLNTERSRSVRRSDKFSAISLYFWIYIAEG